MPHSSKDDPTDPDRKVRNVKWSKEADAMARTMAHDDGYTYDGREHVNEWLEKITKERWVMRKLAAGETLSHDEQMMFDADHLADEARKFYHNLRQQARQKK